MQIYLPIADMPVNVFLIFGMGLAVGFLSGMFGIGGGFLLTPLLIFLGIPPVVAVATVTGHITASLFSGSFAYWRRKALDPALAAMLLAGGLLGTLAGVWLISILRAVGQIDFVLGISYFVLLGIVGVMMITESARAILRVREGSPADLRRPGSHAWFHGLPLKVRFKQSRIYVSVIPIWVLGLLIGLLAAIMGVGGGFLLVPALIYLFRVPTSVVIGTAMMMQLVTMSTATVLHAYTNHSVDVVLALILMVGGVIGAQFGARAGQRIRSEQLRLLLGLLVLLVGLRFAIVLIFEPANLFSLQTYEAMP